MFSALVLGVWCTPLLICGAEPGAKVSAFSPIVWLFLKQIYEGVKIREKVYFVPHLPYSQASSTNLTKTSAWHCL